MKNNNLKKLEELCFEKRKSSVHNLCLARTDFKRVNYRGQKEIKKIIYTEINEEEIRTILLGCIGGILKTINNKQFLRGIMEIEEFFKEIKENNFLQTIWKYKIFSYHEEPFSDGWDTDLDLEDAKLELQRTRLSIEIKGMRYYFKDLEAYKAFKTKFNLL